MTKELEKKVNQAIKLLQSIPQDKGDVELCYSGGKDSDVILELAKMAEIKFKPIYKNTTIDPIGTIKHCKEKGVEIVNPSITFFKLMQKKGYPSRFCRFCCEKLKEYKIYDIAIQGIRKSESLKRNKLYNEPQICRFYGSKKNRVSVFLPILNWTDEDVSEFVSERNIECHPIYYRGGGEFDVKCRLGCIGCPLASKAKRIQEFKENPKFVKLWIKNAQVFYDNHKANTSKKYSNAIESFVSTLFYDSYAEFEAATYTMFGKTDWRKYLEEYFKINLSDIPYNIE